MQLFIYLIFMQCLSSCDMQSAKSHFDVAVKLEEQNQFVQAIKELDKAIKKDSDFLPAYINRACDKTELKDYKGAIKDYDILLSKDSKNVLALVNRGNNKKRLNEYLGAINDYQIAINCKGGEGIWIETNGHFLDEGYDCSMVSIRFERGIAYYDLGELKKSFDDFIFCIKRNYEKKAALYFLGMIYISCNQNDIGCKYLHESSMLGDTDADIEILKYCK